MFGSRCCLCLLLLLLVGCQFSGGAARGVYDIDLADRDLDDDSDATLLRFRGEYTPEDLRDVVGGGFELDVLVIDDDVLGEAEPIGWDGFLYACIRPDLGRFFRLPMRLGPTLQYFELDDPSGEVEWQTVGFRGSIAPEFVLVRSTKITEELSVFGELNGFGGRTIARTEFDKFRDDGDSASAGWGWEAGVRYRYERMQLQGSWIFRHFRSQEANRDFGPDITGLRNRFEGLFVSLSIFFGPNP